jgi:hypothetical protein
MTKIEMSTPDEDELYIVTTTTTVVNKYLIKSLSPDKIKLHFNDIVENELCYNISQKHSMEDVIDIRETSISLALQEADEYLKDRLEDYILEI